MGGPKKTTGGFDFKDASKKANAAAAAKTKANSAGMAAWKNQNTQSKWGQAQEAGIPVAKIIRAAAKLLKSGQIARGADAAARVAVKKAGWQLAKEKAMTAKYGRGLVVNTPNGRIGTNAYPKSYGQSGSRAPVSEVYGPKTTSSMNTRINGGRYVDNRYRYDIKKVK
jgi:hypothetical protein